MARFYFELSTAHSEKVDALLKLEEAMSPRQATAVLEVKLCNLHTTYGEQNVTEVLAKRVNAYHQGPLTELLGQLNMTQFELVALMEGVKFHLGNRPAPKDAPLAA